MCAKNLIRHSFLQQVPPLTPSTNKKINESLKETYATWGKDSERLQVPRDPQSWSKEHVGHWLSWAIREFNLTGLTGQFEQFRVSCMVRKDEPEVFTQPRVHFFTIPALSHTI